MRRLWLTSCYLISSFCGCAITLDAPQYLFAVWLVPGLLLYQIWVWQRRQNLLNRFATASMQAILYRGLAQHIRARLLKWQAALVVLAFTSCILALSEPKWGTTWEQVQNRGVDIVVTLDVSDSMLVTDVQSGDPLSRLERAKRQIADLLEMLHGDRIALVTFAGGAFIECPLTFDYGAAHMFLDDIDTDSIPIKGTNLAEALKTSLKALDTADASSQAIVLITDGEDHAGNIEQAVNEAKQRGIRIFTVGIGRPEGAPIPKADGSFHRDEQGNLILSKLDEATLQHISYTTHGNYTRSGTPGSDLPSIYQHGVKSQLTEQEHGTQNRQRWQARFQWFVSLAMLSLACEAWLARLGGKRLATLLVCLSCLVSKTLLAAKTDPYTAYTNKQYTEALEGFTKIQVEHPHDARVMMNIGSTYYQLQDYEAAKKTFTRALLENPNNQALQAQALYNLGNCAYRQGKFQEAIEHYQQALTADPNDTDANFNLSVARQKLVEQQQQQQQQQQEQPQENSPPQNPNNMDNQPNQEPSSAQKNADANHTTEQAENPNNKQAENPNNQPTAMPSNPNTNAQNVPETAKPAATPETPEGLSLQQAEQYLDTLHETRPKNRLPNKKRPSTPKGKDW